MQENAPNYLSMFLLLGFFVLLFAGNYYYQRKSRRYADEMLKSIPDEYNRQIKANAYRILVSRLIWGLIFLSGIVWNFQKIIAYGFSWLTVLSIAFGVFFIAWGILGFRWELKRLQVLS